MQAMIFLRRNAAFGLGHVGWAFQYNDGSYSEGAVENPSGGPVEPPGQNGFWDSRVPEPFAAMRARNYDAYKAVQVVNFSTTDADNTVAWEAQQYYIAIGSNCEDFTYDVLTSYGADLPLPFFHWAPNDWFAAIPGPEIPLPAAGPAEALAPMAISPTSGVPVAPKWRQKGMPEWTKFQQALCSRQVELRQMRATPA